MMRGFISNKCQEWVLYLKVTKNRVKVPLHESHSIPMPLLPLSPLPDSNLPAVFYSYIGKLISPTPLSGLLSVSHHLLFLWYFIAPPLSLSFPVSLNLFSIL